MTAGRRLASLAAGIGAVLATQVVGVPTSEAAPQTSAAAHDHADPRGDVQQYRDGSKRSTHATDNPWSRAADIVGTEVEHGDTHVSLTLHLRDYRKAQHVVVFQLATPDHSGRWTVGEIDLDGIHDKASLQDQGKDVDCPGLRATTSYTKDEIHYSVPRTCLDSPAWVQAGAAIAVEVPHAKRGYVDFSERRGDADVTADKIPLGPRVFSD